MNYIFAVILIIIIIFAPCSAQGVCDTEPCLKAAQMMIDNGNAEVPACVDFYERACANYRIKYPQIIQMDRHMFDTQIQNLNQQIADVLNRNDNDAPKPVQNARATYRDCITEGKNSRAQTGCVEMMKERFPRVLLYLLATPDVMEEREKTKQMVDYLKRSYVQIIQDSNWLDTNTKEAAARKINSVQLIVGFTDDTIEPQNLQKSLDSRINPFDTSSGYCHETHKIFVPLPVLTFPTNQLGLEVLNYAGLGFNIAHELSRIHDNNGRENAGWSPDMQIKFNEKTECFIQEYDQFMVPGVEGKIGKITVNGNIQDNVGFLITLNAYRLYAKEHAEEKKLIKFEGYSHEKLLMLALANAWCENVLPSYNYKLINTNQRAPGPVRVNGMVMNSSDFAQTWNCEPDAPMNPQHKCSVWKDDNPNN